MTMHGSDRDSSPTPGEGLAPLIDDLQHLAEEARAYAGAELALQKARAVVVALGLRRLALLALGTFVFAVFAVGALTVGLLIALTPLVTAWGATAIVVGLLGVGAGLCLRGIGRAWRRLQRAVGGFAGDRA